MRPARGGAMDRWQAIIVHDPAGPARWLWLSYVSVPGRIVESRCNCMIASAVCVR